MPDISLCDQDACPKAEKCTRYLAKPSPHRQSYIKPEFDKDGCEFFWQVTDNEPFAVRMPKVQKGQG